MLEEFQLEQIVKPLLAWFEKMHGHCPGGV